jgi:hypothetical protein
MKNLKQNVNPPKPQQLTLKITKTGAEKKVAPLLCTTTGAPTGITTRG